MCNMAYTEYSLPSAKKFVETMKYARINDGKGNIVGDYANAGPFNRAHRMNTYTTTINTQIYEYIRAQFERGNQPKLVIILLLNKSACVLLVYVCIV